jgi:hypothetical protein
MKTTFAVLIFMAVPANIEAKEPTCLDLYGQAAERLGGYADASTDFMKNWVPTEEDHIHEIQPRTSREGKSADWKSTYDSESKLLQDAYKIGHADALIEVRRNLSR